jgi:hypothetical protein
MTTAIETPGFLTFTISIVVFFVGASLNRWIAPLRRWNIPEAVTGGLLAALVTLVAHEAFGLAISFDPGTTSFREKKSALFRELKTALSRKLKAKPATFLLRTAGIESGSARGVIAARLVWILWRRRLNTTGTWSGFWSI